MHLLSCAAALMLLGDHGLAQIDRFGLMEDPAPQFWQSGNAQPPFLAKRDGDCGTGKHPCTYTYENCDGRGSDINSTMCCPNDQYCIVSEDFTAQCCDLDSTCGNPCSASMYLTSKLTTITVLESSTVSASVSTESLCATRKCTSSYYGCPSSLGGQCCAFGLNCGIDTQGSGICEGTSSVSSTSKTMSSLVTPLASGCSVQGQTHCTTGGVGGCCGAGYTCTLVSSTQLMCASATASSTSLITPTGSGITVIEKTHGLSTGAKAGIAVGVIVAVAAVLGVLTWFCIRRRRKLRHQGGGSQQAQELASVPPADHRQSGITSDGGLRPYAASSGPHMSEVDGTSSYGYPASSFGGTSYGGGGGGGPGGGAGYWRGNREYQEQDAEVPYSEMGGGTLPPGQTVGAGAAATAAVGGGVAAAINEHDNRAASPEYYGQGGDRGHGAGYGSHGYGYDAVPTTEERAELGAQHHRNGSGFSSDGAGVVGGGPENSAAAAAIASSSAPHQQQPTSPVESIAGRFELDAGAGTGTGAGADDDPDRHDAGHVPGPNASAGHGGGYQWPQPLTTPASEYSEMASPNSINEVHDRETW